MSIKTAVLANEPVGPERCPPRARVCHSCFDFVPETPLIEIKPSLHEEEAQD
jgi:hypothetical protein